MVKQIKSISPQAQLNETALGLSEFVKKNLSNTLVFTEQQFITELADKLSAQYKNIDCSQVLNLLIVTGYVRINDTGVTTVFTYNFTQVLVKRIRNIKDRLDIIREYLKEMELRVKNPEMDPDMLKNFQEAIAQKREAEIGFNEMYKYLQSKNR